MTATLPENGVPDELAQRVDSALRALWRGDSAEFERLLESEAPAGEEPELGLGELLAGALDRHAVPVVGLAGQSEVGGYKIIREIGRGGMGVVYEAEQQEPRRRVALKVLRGLGADEYHVRLFRREIEVQARLRHPAIVTIYEAGHTPDGQHFFTMELVDGVALSTHVRQRDVPLRQRLELFTKICQALQYAHEHGVIHRDLKPSNIMVDAAGSPRILDFGLARITDLESSLTTVTAADGRVAGTLAYMSPEQTRADAEIDARADVYALGVVLYELLTGELPYDLRNVPPHDIVRTIREQPPRRPSAINQALRGDLETIVLKALEKEAARRYQSVADLAADVERYLAGEPIRARPPSGLYLIRKKLAKRRHAILIGGAVSALVLAGVPSGLWWRHRALMAEAGRQMDRLVLHARAGQWEKAIAGCSDIIARGLPVPERSQPYRLRADSYMALGQYEKALPEYTEAIRHNPWAWNYYQRATALWIAGRRREAAEDYREFCRQLSGPSYAEARLFLVLHDEARALTEQGRPDEAQALLQEAESVLGQARRQAEPDSWLERILACLAGELEPSELVNAADLNNLRQRCEACYYAGEVCILRGGMDEARRWFECCRGTSLPLDPSAATPTAMAEYHLALWRLEELADAQPGASQALSEPD